MLSDGFLVLSVITEATLAELIPTSLPAEAGREVVLPPIHARGSFCAVILSRMGAVLHN